MDVSSLFQFVSCKIVTNKKVLSTGSVDLSILYVIYCINMYIHMYSIELRFERYSIMIYILMCVGYFLKHSFTVCVHLEYLLCIHIAHIIHCTHSLYAVLY